MADNGPQAKRAERFQAMADNGPQSVAQRQQMEGGRAVQRQGALDEDEVVQGNFEPAQKTGAPAEGWIQTRLSSQHVAQRAPDNNFSVQYSNSSFQSTDREKVETYAILDKSRDVYYVGKTDQGIQTRFSQHQAEGKFTDPTFFPEKIDSGNWTPFETATKEQYGIGFYGGKKVLDNSINALTIDKWNWFKTPPGEDINKLQEIKLDASHFK